MRKQHSMISAARTAGKTGTAACRGRRTRALVLASAVLLGLSGGARAQPFNTAASLVFFDAAGNETLDPAEPQSGSSFSQEVFLALFDTIVRLDDAGNTTPGLAESWTVSPDLKSFTFTLRANVKLHDGTMLTAALVKQNLERNIGLGRRVSGTMLESIKLIESIDELGPLQIRINQKSPSGQLPYFLGGIAGMTAAPASWARDAFGASYTPIGSGPFRLKSFQSNVKTVLVRNEEYWGGTADRPAVFEHHYVPDGRARLNAVRSGQATVAMIDPRQMPEAKGAGLATQINEKNGFWGFYFNLSRDSLKNLKVRQAMMHAIDRAAMAEALSFGSGKPSVQMFASSSPVTDAALETIYPHDPAKARALLAEAGYKDGLDLTQMLLNTSEYRAYAEALQAMFAEANIRVKFDVVDASQFSQFVRPPYRGDILLARWGGRADPLQTFQELVASQGTYSPFDAATPEIDAMLAKARGLLPDDPERLTFLRRAGRLSVEHVAIMPFMTRSNVYAYKPGCIQGLTPFLSMGDDRFNDVKVAAGCK